VFYSLTVTSLFARIMGRHRERYEFTGKPQDFFSGLYYYGARYYDVSIGRFTSRDPFFGKPSRPQTLNPYAYVMNNPCTNNDPTGRESADVIAANYEARLAVNQPINQGNVGSADRIAALYQARQAANLPASLDAGDAMDRFALRTASQSASLDAGEARD